MFKKVVLSALLAGISSSSFAGGGQSSCDFPWPLSILFCPAPVNNPPGTPAKAPEMDATVAVAAVTLLVGGVLVVRGRRRRAK